MSDNSRKDKERKLLNMYEDDYNKLVRYTYAHIGNLQDAEDLAAEAFIKAFKSLDQYQERGIPMRAWLFRIAHNLMVDHLRGKNRYPTVSLPAELVGEEDPEREAEANLQIEEVRKAIKYLTPAQQEVISLRFFAGLSAKEIGAIMGKRAGAVREMQAAALRSLREILSKKARDGP